MKLSMIDYGIIAVYFVFVLGIGFLLKRRVKSSGDFLMSGKSIPLWITSLAFISANLGAQEVIGMAASGAKYGIMTAHFYWVGAIPAMIFLGVFMMPFYYGSRARSVPEYLKLRFDEKTRSFNALSFAAMTVFSSGVSLYALAILLQSLLGWSFEVSVWLSGGIVLAYILTGGLTSAIYNEVLQFFLIVLGIAPLVFAGLHQVGGWSGIEQQLPAVMTHTWQNMGSAADNPMGVNMFQMVMGLGFVLSFGYWCTDFLVVQRAMVAHNMSAAQRTPIVAAVPKMLIPFIVILPGLIALVLTKTDGSFALPLKPDGRMDFDMTLPVMLSHYYPTGLLGIGLTALMASFMSGMAGNVTAFNAVWTYDIYQTHFKKNAPDKHYLWVGRMATLFGILLSVATAYLARSFNNIMDLLQLVFGFVNAPLFATFLLGMFWRRTTGHGAFWGLLSGTVMAAITQGITIAEGKGGWMLSTPVHEFSSAMAQAFAIAIVAWTSCFVITILISLATKAKPADELRGLVYSLTEKPKETGVAWYLRPAPLAGAVLAAVIALNFVLR
ncbi:MAG: Na+/galactose cotransporter [Bdellovibrionales bacterium RIFOXYC1_FULL_54_43]|nr:MAG: Na+/galactose cotransporter [Bdellovibrionales bacterium RIFOXYC1_FULL_54_43]OFZ85049.1 MAG: Na+/galactose cotransporter [Bdellovibrionales bacterium RIFOXYD1_FULL_55_31]